MSLRLRFHEDALRELADAIEWYDQGEQGRGERFRRDVDSMIDRCLAWPESGAVVPMTDPAATPTFRHAKVPRSHYRIMYVVDGEVLDVIAIAHERRTPRYWSGRR